MAMVSGVLGRLGMTEPPVIWFSATTLQPPHSSNSSFVAKGLTALLVLGTGTH